MNERSGQGPTAAWRPLVVPFLVLAVLAVWWAVLLPRAERSVFARVPVLDEVYYLDRAADSSDEPAVNFISPLYPRLIALAGSAQAVPEDMVVPAASLRGIRLLQIGCWLGVVLLLHLITRRALPPDEDHPAFHQLLLWLPSLLFVLYRPASVYAVTILLELPLVLLLTLYLYCLTWLGQSARRHHWWPVVLSGLALGSAALLRGTALSLLPLAVWGLLKSPLPGRLKTLRVLLLLAAVALPLLPASIENSRQAGRLTGPTFNAGVNLYVGNGPEANGFYVAAVPGDWRRDPAGQDFLAGRLGLPAVSLAQADSIWTAEALNTITARPRHTAGLWLKKFWLHLQSWEIDQLTPLTGWTREVPLLRVLALPFGLLVMLGLAGLIAVQGKAPSARLWAAGLFLIIASQSVFFVVSRYRLALVPLLCLLAAAGLGRIVSSWHSTHRPMLLWTGAAVVASLLIYPWGLTEVQSRWVPLAQANEARRWGVIGQAENSPMALARAEQLYLASIEGQPDSPAPWLGLAVTQKALNKRAEAEDTLTRAILRVDRNLDIRRMLVGMLLEDDRRSDALVQAQALLREYPDDAETLHNATVLLASFGNTRAALEMAERLVAAHPADPRGAVDQGVLLARAGRTEEARAAFYRGLSFNPKNETLRRNLDLLDSRP
jgi:tetratricopeptide (TPR) repeat protein